MGSGKTQKTIKYIQEDKRNKRYLIVVPLLSEVGRYQNALSHFKTPSLKTKLKKDELLELLVMGENIIITHSLYQLLSDLHREAIHLQEYHLILDEDISPIELFHFNTSKDKAIFFEHFGYIGEDDYLYWDYIKHPIHLHTKGSVFFDIMMLCQNKSLRASKDRTTIYEEFNITNFKAFESITILTYLFEGSLLQSYFQKFGMYYRTMYLNDEFLSDIDTSRDKIKTEIVPLINICENHKLNEIGASNFALSSTWYNNFAKARETTDIMKTLKKNVKNYFTNICEGTSDENMWTCFVKNRAQLKGAGYSKGFISFNTRATNEHIGRKNLALLVNIFHNPLIIKYFKEAGIDVDSDRYALSIMLQWIFRSRIRQGKSINLYLPSSRMRNILEKYLSN